jgi:hypothetical protein
MVYYYLQVCSGEIRLIPVDSTRGLKYFVSFA